MMFDRKELDLMVQDPIDLVVMFLNKSLLKNKMIKFIFS